MSVIVQGSTNYTLYINPVISIFVWQIPREVQAVLRNLSIDSTAWISLTGRQKGHEWSHDNTPECPTYQLVNKIWKL